MCAGVRGRRVYVCWCEGGEGGTSGRVRRVVLTSSMELSLCSSRCATSERRPGRGGWWRRREWRWRGSWGGGGK